MTPINLRFLSLRVLYGRINKQKNQACDYIRVFREKVQGSFAKSVRCFVFCAQECAC